MSTVITTIEELREHMGIGGDYLNQLLPVSAQAMDQRGNEQVYIDYATTFQFEGFVLHPRRLDSIPVEIVTEDADECRYILHCVRTSQVHLAARQAQCLSLSISPFMGDRTPDLEPPTTNTFGQLGAMATPESKV